MQEISRKTENWLASQEGFCSMQQLSKTQVLLQATRKQNENLKTVLERGKIVVYSNA
jgi:hypothetical protein